MEMEGEMGVGISCRIRRNNLIQTTFYKSLRPVLEPNVLPPHLRALLASDPVPHHFDSFLRPRVDHNPRGPQGTGHEIRGRPQDVFSTYQSRQERSVIHTAARTFILPHLDSFRSPRPQLVGFHKARDESTEVSRGPSIEHNTYQDGRRAHDARRQGRIHGAFSQHPRVHSTKIFEAVGLPVSNVGVHLIHMKISVGC